MIRLLRDSSPSFDELLEQLIQQLIDDGPGQSSDTFTPLQSTTSLHVPRFSLHSVLKMPPGLGQHLIESEPEQYPLTVDSEH